MSATQMIQAWPELVPCYFHPLPISTQHALHSSRLVVRRSMGASAICPAGSLAGSAHEPSSGLAVGEGQL